MPTNVIALDVYGTFLPTKGVQVARAGFREFVEKCQNRGINLCTISDAELPDLLKDFRKAGIDSRIFNKMFEMPRISVDGKHFTQSPKNLSPVIDHYMLWEDPARLVVIGDNPIRDILPAANLGCHTLLIERYRNAGYDSFDFKEVVLP